MEDEKISEFHKFMMDQNPKIATCIEFMRFIEKFIDYKLQNVGALDSIRDKMDAEFASLIDKNFGQEL